jgi:ribosomal protein S6
MPKTLSEEDVKATQEQVNNFVVESEGALNRIEDLSKNGSAYLATVNFYLKPEKIADLNAKLKSQVKITNFLLLNKKPRAAEAPRRIRRQIETAKEGARVLEKRKKVEIKEIEKKLEEILEERH